MSSSIRKSEWLVWAGLGMTAALVLLTFLLAVLKIRVASNRPLPVYGNIADFALTNQNGRAVSLADLRGNAWVADIIFTRCPGPCLGMTRRMKSLQQLLPEGSQAKLVTLTTDPDFDTPAVLKAYAERFGADPKRWLFLTGAKQQVGDLATRSLKLAAVGKKPEERQSPDDLFIHSTIFVVVDKQARLRGVFETTGDQTDPRRVQSDIIAAVKRLERE